MCAVDTGMGVLSFHLPCFISAVIQQTAFFGGLDLQSEGFKEKDRCVKMLRTCGGLYIPVGFYINFCLINNRVFKVVFLKWGLTTFIS